jgi:hypothetical protein
VNAVPHIVVEADYYAPFIEHLLVVVAEGEECEPFLVSVIDLVDAGYS